MRSVLSPNSGVGTREIDTRITRTCSTDWSKGWDFPEYWFGPGICLSRKVRKYTGMAIILHTCVMLGPALIYYKCDTVQWRPTYWVEWLYPMVMTATRISARSGIWVMFLLIEGRCILIPKRGKFNVWWLFLTHHCSRQNEGLNPAVDRKLGRRLYFCHSAERDPWLFFFSFGEWENNFLSARREEFGWMGSWFLRSQVNKRKRALCATLNVKAECRAISIFLFSLMTNCKRKYQTAILSYYYYI